jgi:hypothetical protein
MQTPVTPVITEQNRELFVDASDVPHETVNVGGKTQSTAPLLVNEPVNLLGISTTKELLSSGAIDNTDSLDTRLSLAGVAIRYKGLTAVVDVSDRHLSNFSQSPEGRDGSLTLHFKGNVKVPLKATTWLRLLNTLFYVIGLEPKVKTESVWVHLVGYADIHTGNVCVNVEATQGGVEVLGYSLSARRLNYNVGNRAP